MRTTLEWLASELSCNNMGCSADEIQSNGVVHFEDHASVKQVPLCGLVPCYAFVFQIVLPLPTFSSSSEEDLHRKGCPG